MGILFAAKNGSVKWRQKCETEAKMRKKKAVMKILAYMLAISLAAGIGPAAGFASEEKAGSKEGGEQTAMHEPYIDGYPDGTFKAGNNVSREEVSKMLVTALKAKTDEAVTVSSYQDVPLSRWSSVYIEAASALKIMEGYGEGVFGPARPMSRAELAACLARIAESEDKKPSFSAPAFTDVKEGGWYYEYVKKAAEFGYITGYQDGTFMPDKSVSRAEAVTMINRMLGRGPDSEIMPEDLVNPFSDLSQSHWAYWQILEAAVLHEAGALITDEEPPKAIIIRDGGGDGARGYSININAEAGKTYDVTLIAENIRAYNNMYVTVTYSGSVFALDDIYAFTKEKETTEGHIEGSGITVTEARDGRITLKSDITPGGNGETWSGVITVISFKARTSGTGTVQAYM
jgi:hypothetical protein